MIDMEGTALDAATADFIRTHDIRAVCLFRKNLGSESEVQRLCADLRELMGPEALIGIDQEGGSVVRATFLPQPPAAMALGAADDAALAEAVGAAVARGLRGLGINWNFAPVLDINNNPANPVIAERSFGEDAERVTRLAGAWMRGSLAEGVACCVKHFPGHGDTHVDSHHALPAVDKSLAQLEALELKPFRALAPEAPAVMTAHIVYPQIDPEHPATLSEAVLNGILRNSFGFDGVVITDALMMKAIHDRYGHARAAVLALQAGADLVLAQGARHEQIAALEAIDAALRDGSVALTRANEARTRVAALAARFPIRAERYADAQRTTDDALMRAAWARGLVALGTPRAPHVDERLRVFTQRSVPCDGVSEAGPSAEQIAALFAGFADVEFIALDRLDDLGGSAMPRDGRFNVLASNHRARYGAAAAGWRPDLHLVLWNPYQALDVAAPALISWGYADGALAAVKAWLEGHASALPTPPVTLAPRAA
jgi:beta-N-acetylhexosaminidase